MSLPVEHLENYLGRWTTSEPSETLPYGGLEWIYPEIMTEYYATPLEKRGEFLAQRPVPDPQKMYSHLKQLVFENEWYIQQPITQNNPEFARQVNLLDDAFHFAYEAFGNQCRFSGEPSITHSLANAILLAQESIVDIEVIVGAILHDVVEDIESVSREDISRKFGENIATLVDAVTNVQETTLITAEGKDQAQSPSQKKSIEAQSVAKLMESAQTDPRALLIKVADVAHNQATAWGLTEGRRKTKAKLALRIYEKLARRLGLIGLSKIIGDNAFAILKPYEAIEIYSKKQALEHIRGLIKQEVDKWDLTNDENGVYHATKYESLEIEIPSIYEIWQEKTKAKNGTDDSQILPHVNIVFRNITEAASWDEYLRKNYSVNKINPTQDLIVDLDNRGLASRMVKLIPNQPEIKVNIILYKTRASPAEYFRIKSRIQPVDNTDFMLTSYHAVESLQTALLEVDNTSDTTEALVTERVNYFDPDGREHNIPKYSTWLDAAYGAGINLGNEAISVLIRKHGNDEWESASLYDEIIPDYQFKIITCKELNCLPRTITAAEYDFTETHKARREIKQAIDKQSSPDRMKFAKKRGFHILKWLYESETGQNMDIPPESEYTSGLMGNFDEFLTVLGMQPIPSGKYHHLSLWKNPFDEEAVPDRQCIQEVFTLIETMSYARKQMSEIRITLPRDKIGIFSRISAIARAGKISIFPRYEIADGGIYLYILPLEKDKAKIEEFIHNLKGSGLLASYEIIIVPPSKDKKRQVFGS